MGGNGVCTSKINTQGKRNCVGGDQLCGINLATHKAAHKGEDTCGSLNKYLSNMIKCDKGYQAYIDGDGTSNQGNCLFKCQPAGSCCGISADADSECVFNNKDECDSESSKCIWKQNGC